MKDCLPWIRRLNPQARMRLLCFPHAGGTSIEYREWHEGFPGTVEVCPVVLPGRETRLREDGFSDLRKASRVLARALAPVLADAPFALYGHSMGSWLAYGLTHELQRTGGPTPTHLFVAARHAPQVVDGGLGPLYHLGDAEFQRALDTRYKAIPSQVLNNRELMELFLPKLRADFTLIDAYRWMGDAPLDVPITAFRGETDHATTDEEMKAWSERTTRTFDFRRMPGGHFFLRDSRDLLTDAIGGVLARALRAPAG